MIFFPKTVVGLDFHDYYAQVVELKSSGSKVELVSFNRTSIPPQIIKDGEIMDKDELKSILIGFLDSSNPHPIESKNVVCSFPSKKVFTHIFEFPAYLSIAEIKKALPFEAETVIPFSIQDVYWDISILKKDTSGSKQAAQEVLFACVPKTTADSYVDLLSSIGLTPFAFTIPSDCAYYALSKQLPKGKSALVIDVGSLVTTFSLFENGILKNTFTSLEGGKSLISALSKNYQITESEILDQKEKGSLDKVYLPEVEKFIRNTLKEGSDFMNGNDVVEVFVTGEFLNLPNFFESTKKFFPNQKVSFGDPRVGIDIDSEKFVPLDKKESYIPYSVYFTQAFGLSLKGLKPKLNDGINLLPDRLREGFVSKKLSLGVSVASILLALISMTVAVFITYYQQSESYRRISTEAEKQSLQQLVFGTRYLEIKNAITNFNQEVKTLVSVQGSVFSLPALIQDIRSSLPSGIKISGFTFNDEDLSVDLSGVADDRESLLAAQENFKKASFVEEVIAPRSNFDNKYDISFFLKLKLKFNELTPYADNK